MEVTMRRFLKISLGAALLSACGLAISQRPAKSQSNIPNTVTPEQYLKWEAEFKTWGKWGPDDQRGMTNLITPEKVRSAMKLVKDGLVSSIAHPVPQQADAEVSPASVFHRTTNNITATGTTDNYQVSYHGLALSHMDSFCHVFAEGKNYNGVPVAENITPETGCKKDSVMVWKDGVVTRA